VIVNETDVLIIGSGIAGLNCARLIDSKYSVVVLSKEKLDAGASILAQGGIAAVTGLNPEDSIENHIKDTIKVGSGLCNQEVVEYTVRDGDEAIKNLIDIGVNFSYRSDSEYDLTREGGHSKRRIFHSEDITGVSIINSLINSIKKKSNISVYEFYTAISLIKNNNNQISGAFVLNKNSEIEAVISKVVVLATGGLGKVYLYTSNPDTATGDGVAMAYRAGAKIANMEFFQFHPTCLYDPKAKNFLISEALRGEGGVLKLPDGHSFMQYYDERKDLAPRDIVARAIDNEIKKQGLDFVYLDIRHLGVDFIINRFPNIYKKCLEYNLDITKDMIPVVPAAHYACGGIMVDLEGKTNLKGLSACGECAHTGLHGANRLASNSLLEAMVFSKVVANNISSNMLEKYELVKDIVWQEAWTKKSDETVLIHHNWDELRRTMWHNVGIVRSVERLKRASNRIEMIKHETESYYWKYKISKDLIELRNLITVAELIVRCASSRLESRGLHYMKDYPSSNDAYLKDTII